MRRYRWGDLSGILFSVKFIGLGLVALLVAAFLSYGDLTRDCSTYGGYDPSNGTYTDPAECDREKTQAQFEVAIEGGVALGLIIAAVAWKRGWYAKRHIGRREPEEPDVG